VSAAHQADFLTDVLVRRRVAFIDEQQHVVQLQDINTRRDSMQTVEITTDNSAVFDLVDYGTSQADFG
jgi:hypothetical protein